MINGTGYSGHAETDLEDTMADVTYAELMDDPVAAADFARYRAGIYRLASSVFMFDATEEGLAAQIAAAVSADADSCVRPCEEVLYSYLRGFADCDLALLRTKVATEYAELFVGPRPPLAPYYESVYLGANPRLFADVTMRVRAEYKAQGFQVDKRNKVPDDHIGYELAFMAQLCEREAQAHEAGDADEVTAAQVAQDNFLAIHLGVWIGFLADRIASAWCADYYEVWARFVQAFVEADKAFFASCADLPVSTGKKQNA